MAEEIRVIQYGLGPIGCATARYVHELKAVQLVGGVDAAPGKIGRDLGDIIGLDRSLDVTVYKDIDDVLVKAGADVVLHTTNSYFPQFKSQIIELLEAGLDIVSTSEELSFPWLENPDDGRDIDAAAKRAGKSVIGTGVNPGFLMDTLPLSLTAICQRVDRIEVSRVQNASKRRGPFQAKIGSGMTVEEFNTEMGEGRMGHVGLPESVGMIFHRLGKELVKYESTVEPVIAARKIVTDAFDVPHGRVCGLKQVARGYDNEGEFVTLTFVAALDSEEDQDTIRITGKPNLEITLRGTNGDIATAAIAVNAIPRVLAAPPGLLTMPDLPIVTL